MVGGRRKFVTDYTQPQVCRVFEVSERKEVQKGEEMVVKNVKDSFDKPEIDLQTKTSFCQYEMFC